LTTRYPFSVGPARCIQPALGQHAVADDLGGDLLALLLGSTGDIDGDGDCHRGLLSLWDWYRRARSTRRPVGDRPLPRAAGLHS